MTRKKQVMVNPKTFIGGQTFMGVGPGQRMAAPTADRNRIFQASHNRTIGTACGATVENRYKLYAVIGWGGMGTVYLAYDKKDEAIKAVKIWEIIPMNKEIKHILSEAQVIMRLCHRNIVRIEDIGVHGGHPFIVMEFMRGETLEELLARQQVLPWERIRSIAAQVCRGLGALHNEGIIHRDVKPHNLFLTDEGTVKVIDFEISRFPLFRTIEKDKVTEGVLLGTPVYLAPELARGGIDFDHRADVYSVGIMIYEMLCGRVPFEGDVVKVLHGHLKMKPTPPGRMAKGIEIPDRVEDLVMKALEKDPGKRFGSMDEMRMAILSCRPDPGFLYRTGGLEFWAQRNERGGVPLTVPLMPSTSF